MVLGALMDAEMREQPAVLLRLATRFPDLIRTVLAVVPSPLAGTTFVARGSSDNAALLGRYLVELHSHRPAGMAAPSLFTRYGAHVDYHGQLVIALSQSGVTPEIIATSDAMRSGGATLVAVTNDPRSPLATAADAVLSTDAGPEKAVPATKTVTAQMLLMYAIAQSLSDQPAVPITTLVGAVADVLADEEPAAALAARWAAADRLYVAGRGLFYPAALETALKIKEAAGVLAEGISIADLLHGPISSVAHGIPVLILGPDGHTRRDVEELVQRLTPTADVALMSADAGADLCLPAGAPAIASAICATVRGQQLALHLARQHGLDPDQPVGLSKITPTT